MNMVGPKCNLQTTRLGNCHHAVRRGGKLYLRMSECSQANQMPVARLFSTALCVVDQLKNRDQHIQMRKCNMQARFCSFVEYRYSLKLASNRIYGYSKAERRHPEIIVASKSAKGMAG